MSVCRRELSSQGGAWCGALLVLLAGALPDVARGEVVSVGPGVPPGAGPRFVGAQRRTVVAPLGHEATLLCAVTHLGDKTVSWVRSRDLQILSHAGHVFTADARVSASSSAGEGSSSSSSSSSVHSLRIERLRESDSGSYECQLNTEPKMSLFFNLTVVDEAVPVVVLSSVPGGVVHSSAGGSATLWCEARYRPAPRLLPAPPLEVVWGRGGAGGDAALLSRGGVTRDTERWGARLVSRLTLTALTHADGGRYVCRAGPHAHTLTLALTGSSAEAMQRDQGATSGAGRGPGRTPWGPGGAPWGPGGAPWGPGGAPWGPGGTLWGLCALVVLAGR